MDGSCGRDEGMEGIKSDELDHVHRMELRGGRVHK